MTPPAAKRLSFEGNKQIVWDATSVERAQTCLRKYYYSLILHLEPHRKSVHLIFGGIYASALELFHKKRAEGLDTEAALVETVRYALTASWDYDRDSNGQPIPGTGQAYNFNHANKNRLTLVRTIVWYIDQFADEDKFGIETVLLRNGKPAVELSFIIEFNSEIMYAGHMDRVVRYGGGLYWMDQKTTGHTISPAFFDQFKPNNQVYGYTFAGKVIMEEPLQGGIIDGAQIAVQFSRFERQPIPVTQDQLDEWVDNTMDTVYRTWEAAERNRWPMNLSACGNYGGCEFRHVCSRSPAVRDKFLEGDFVVRDQPWDPASPR